MLKLSKLKNAVQTNSDAILSSIAVGASVAIVSLVYIKHIKYPRKGMASFEVPFSALTDLVNERINGIAFSGEGYSFVLINNPKQ